MACMLQLPTEENCCPGGRDPCSIESSYWDSMVLLQPVLLQPVQSGLKQDHRIPVAWCVLEKPTFHLRCPPSHCLALAICVSHVPEVRGVRQTEGHCAITLMPWECVSEIKRKPGLPNRKPGLFIIFYVTRRNARKSNQHRRDVRNHMAIGRLLQTVDTLDLEVAIETDDHHKTDDLIDAYAALEKRTKVRWYNMNFLVCPALCRPCCIPTKCPSLMMNTCRVLLAARVHHHRGALCSHRVAWCSREGLLRVDAVAEEQLLDDDAVDVQWLMERRRSGR
eukprot:jgi/Botrbrau1/9814/Bobra.0322s0018.1